MNMYTQINLYNSERVFKMEYEIKETEIEYKVGKYFQASYGELYQIIYDTDRGHALLNVEKGTIDSDFHESMSDFLKYTTITNMKPLVQTAEAKFEVSLT